MKLYSTTEKPNKFNTELRKLISAVCRQKTKISNPDFGSENPDSVSSTDSNTILKHSVLQEYSPMITKHKQLRVKSLTL